MKVLYKKRCFSFNNNSIILKYLCIIVIVISVSSCKKNKDKLIGSKWVLYMYKDEKISNPITINDTLFFVTSTKYNYNKNNSSYNLSKVGNKQYHLRLSATVFGNLSGTITYNFMETGTINNVGFTQQVYNGKVFSLWLRKIN